MKPKMRRMLKKMAETAVADAPRDWGIYLVRCEDGSLYTGATNDLEQRLKKHNAGRGAAYTRTRRPVTLHYHEAGMTRSEALIREAKIKSLPKKAKEALRRP
jgi:predicted GIY-YIG superfamily endonuclease